MKKIKFTKQDEINILDLFQYSMKKQKEIARLFGVSPIIIRQVIYKHLNKEQIAEIRETHRKIKYRQRLIEMRERYQKDPAYRKMIIERQKKYGN